MPAVAPFGEVLEAADKLSSEDQLVLIGILNRRLAEAGRRRVVADVQESKREFADGHCRPATPDDLLREILS